MQGAATQAMADIVEDPELSSGRAPPGCVPQAARLVASSSHCPYFTPSIVAPLLMRFQVWLRSGAHMCMNIRPRKPDESLQKYPGPLHAQTLEIEGLQACPGLEMTNDK